MSVSRLVTVAGAAALGFVAILAAANTQAPAQEPSFALYCRGPLNTLRSDGGKVIKTPFKWAKEVAMKERPGAGQCAWANAQPPGIESKPGESAVMIGNLGPFDTLPVGTIGKVCVSKASNPDAGPGNELVVRQIVRHLGHQTSPFHVPPFNAEGCTS
jgi:hypothetical protein